MEPSTLNHIQVDAIREISNIGIGHAATALARLLDAPVTMKVPSVNLLNISAVHEFVGGAELPVAGLVLQVSGDLDGLLLLLFPIENALSLVKQLTGSSATDPGQLEELELSALVEIGNILSSAYLNAMAAMLDLTLFPSVPLLKLDMAGAVLDPILTRQCLSGDTSLLVTAEFSTAAGHVAGKFFLMPDPDSLDIILKASGTHNA